MSSHLTGADNSNISAKAIEARAGEQLEVPGLIERKVGVPPGYLKQRRATPGGPRSTGTIT